jgi:para-nitrobenzyl esterase
MTTVEITSGRIAGVRGNFVNSFLGIRYAAPPVLGRRFQSPKPPASWSGVRPAMEFGPAQPQRIESTVGWIYTPPGSMSEDSLSLNVWAPVDAARRPVVVWIHGGGFRTGATSMPLFDGQRFAALANVVFVSINHRNSTLGWLSHPEFEDADTGATGNWGLQDQVLSLRWVRDNIGAFGGDASRVTVMGQSGGAINATMIGQNPLTRSLLHQLILLSPPYIATPGFADLADAALLTEDLAHALGTSVGGLRDTAVEDLQMAELSQWLSGRVPTRTGRFMRGPVADGLTVVDWPAALDLPSVPTILGYTRTEGTFWTDLIEPSGRRLSANSPTGAVERAACNQFLGRTFDAQSPSRLSAIVDTYFATYEGNETDAPSGVLAELFGDALLRQYGLRAAACAARKGKQDLYVFDYALPLLPPGRGVPHCCELPIVFGTFDLPHYRDKVGHDAYRRSLSDVVIRSFGAFAECGRPTTRDIARWPEFDPNGETTLTLGATGALAKVGRTPKAEILACFDGLGPQPAD